MSQRKLWSPLYSDQTRDVEVKDADGRVQFVLRFAWRPSEDGRVYWVDWAVYEAVSWSYPDWVPSFECPDYRCPGDETSNLDEAAPMAHGMVKWDGCTQFHLDDGAHYDHRASLEAFFNAILEARRYATVEIIGETAMDKEYA